jgi:hypothetical protein
MHRTTHGRVGSAGRLLVIACYVAILLAGSLLHDDVTCHLQARPDCETCASGDDAADVAIVDTLASTPVLLLAASGTPNNPPVHVRSLVARRSLSDRSPPTVPVLR